MSDGYHMCSVFIYIPLYSGQQTHGVANQRELAREISWSDKLSAVLKLRRDSVRVCNELFASLLISQHR